MKISVVVPVYNVQEYLLLCLDSLYAQVDDTTEVILINDGSTDHSLATCNEYAIEYSNTIVIDKDNGGLSDARNVGTKAATGDYIYYLDSDDWLAPNAIKVLYDFAIENDCEIVQGGFYYAYDDYLLYDNKFRKPFVLDRHDAMLELIKNDYVKNFAWGKLYRADIVKRHQFPNGRYYEDSYWQHLIVQECNRYGIVPTPLYYYRQRNSGISGEFSLKNLDLLRGYEERLKFVQEYYPEFISQMTSTLWNLAYSMLIISDKSEDTMIRNSYQEYWLKMNQRYLDLFEQLMAKDIKYIISQKCPYMMPIYGLWQSIQDKFRLSSRYKTINRV